MQSTTHQKLHSTREINKWLQRTGAAGFAFFLIKGLAWIVAALWAVY